MEAFLIDFEISLTFQSPTPDIFGLGAAWTCLSKTSKISGHLVWLTDALQINWSASSVIDFKKSKKAWKLFKWFWNQKEKPTFQSPTPDIFGLGAAWTCLSKRHQRYPVILVWLTDALQINWSASSVIDFKKIKEKHGSFSNWFWNLTNISIANTEYLWSWSRVNVLIKDIKDIRSSWCDWLTRAPD